MRKMANRRLSYPRSTGDEETISLVEHFEQVQSRIEDLLKQAKALITVIKRRVTVNKDHVKAVQKLTQYMHEDPQTKQLKFDGMLESHWSTIKEKLTAEAMRVSRVSSTLENQSLQPLQVFLFTDLEKRFQSTVQDGRKIIKEHTNARGLLQKAKDKYYGFASEWEGSLVAIYHEFGDTWNPMPGSKLHEKEIQLCKRMEDGKADYEASVQYINSLQQDMIGSQLPKVLEVLRGIAENMVAVVNTALKCFSGMQHLLLDGDSAINLREDRQREQFNAVDHCQCFMFKGISYSKLPSPNEYEFIEFPFKDETLMIQTRKVQYQCMSKLSPQELASRAHHFLGEGNRRSAGHQRNSDISSSNTGSKSLVSLCLKYLHQPLALKEEGLFRVSGDTVVVKSLHADFVSGKATKEYLQASIMKQEDPNTVSSLLKLHLREHPFLSHQSITALDTAMQKDKGDIVSIVMSDLASSELIILTDIIQLLHTVVQDPWRSKNKMTAHTLGIACGLSLFPQLDPSKATVLTERLIVDYETLKQSHSVL